ncbi:hypothetical protein D3C75_1143290 [compost metagenome]
MQLVAVLQVKVVQIRILAIERIEIDEVFTTVALEYQAGNISRLGQYRALANRVQ